MADSELVAVCKFLNELSLDEIIRYGPSETAARSDESVCSNDHVEPSVTGITSDEDSGSEDQSPGKKKRKAAPKSDLQRQRQRAYDKKCRTKKKTTHVTNRDAFISALNELIRLVHYSLLRTANENKLLCLAKKNGAVDVPVDTLHQVKLNDGTIHCIESCVKDWEKQKNGETGKFFLRGYTKEIQGLMDKLMALEVELRAATDVLRWEGRIFGVFVQM